MAEFFVKNKEYHEAISYYSRIIQIYEKDQIKFDDKYIYACFYEGICYKNINFYLFRLLVLMMISGINLNTSHLYVYILIVTFVHIIPYHY